MKILVVGSGGREHALCWAVKRDAPKAALFCAPGNPGTASLAANLPTPASDLAGLEQAAREHLVDLVIVGPEAPLAAGIADRLAAAGIPVFGPSAQAAQIEASKAFAKCIMAEAGVPTAASQTVTTLDAAEAVIANHPEPLVVKASGLTGGKGSIICSSRGEARSAARTMLEEGRFGVSGREVVIEEFMEGEELSVFALTDGERIVMLPASQDHKRLRDGDEGPNTGGMGAYAPVSVATPEVLKRVREEIILPTLGQLASIGAPYQGVLYVGLMLRTDRQPAVVEFNCRFGDPEAQVVLPLLGPGLLDLMVDIAANGRLPQDAEDRGSTGAAVVTVLAAPGYPEKPRIGDPIDIPADLDSDVLIFHAGTKRADNGTLVTSGGRVLGIVGLGTDVPAAARVSGAAAQRITLSGGVYRRDIAWRELARAGAA